LPRTVGPSFTTVDARLRVIHGRRLAPTAVSMRTGAPRPARPVTYPVRPGSDGSRRTVVDPTIDRAPGGDGHRADRGGRRPMTDVGPHGDDRCSPRRRRPAEGPAGGGGRAACRAPLV